MSSEPPVPNDEELADNPSIPFDQETLLQHLSTLNDEMLTAIPLTPFEQRKRMLFGNEYTPLSLSSIEVPPGVDPAAISSALEKNYQNYQDRVGEILLTQDITEWGMAPEKVHPLSNKEGKIDLSKEKKYIQFLDLVMSIDPKTVTPDNVVDTVKKLGGVFLTCFQSVSGNNSKG
jgi:hypothetical protein